MSARIVLSAADFKVSKPGYDVFSATDDQLVIDGAKHGLGLYQSGQVTIGAGQKANVSYSNPFGTIPYIIVQADRGGSAAGGGFYRYTQTTSTIEDTVPPYRRYETTRVAGVCQGLDGWHSTATIFIRNEDAVTRTFRYLIFYTAQASGAGGSYDVVPDPMDWTNISGTANQFTPVAGNVNYVNGIGGPIGMRLRSDVTLGPNQSMQVMVDGQVGATIGNGNNVATWTVSPGQSLAFRYLGSAAFGPATMRVDNLASGQNDIDTFVVTATAEPDYIIDTAFPHVSGTKNSGGNTFVIADQRQTITGINQPVSLKLTVSSPFTDGEVLQAYVNNNLITTASGAQMETGNFTVVNGDAIVFRHAKMAGSAARTIYIFNNTMGFNNAQYNSTLTDTYAPTPDNTVDPVDWSDVDAEAWNTSAIGYSSTRLISGINQTVTLSLRMNAALPSGVTISVLKNGAFAGSIGAGEAWLDFTVVNGDQIQFRGVKSTVGSWSGLGAVYNVTTGLTIVDGQVAFSLSRQNGTQA